MYISSELLVTTLLHALEEATCCNTVHRNTPYKIMTKQKTLIFFHIRYSVLCENVHTMLSVTIGQRIQLIVKSETLIARQLAFP